jgi:hypothetical protein
MSKGALSSKECSARSTIYKRTQSAPWKKTTATLAKIHAVRRKSLHQQLTNVQLVCRSYSKNDKEALQLVTTIMDDETESERAMRSKEVVVAVEVSEK